MPPAKRAPAKKASTRGLSVAAPPVPPSNGVRIQVVIPAQPVSSQQASQPAVAQPPAQPPIPLPPPVPVAVQAFNPLVVALAPAPVPALVPVLNPPAVHPINAATAGTMVASSSTYSGAQKRKDPPTTGEQGASKKKKAPEIEDLDPAMVTVTVGGKEFRIHKELACYYSPFFRAAFEGSFLEGQTQTMKLDTTSKEAFALFVRWIYKKTLDSSTGKTTHKQAVLYLLALLADKMLIPELQNLALREVYKSMLQTKKTNTSYISLIHEQTLPGNPIRRMLADTISLNLNFDSLKRFIEENQSTPEFLGDMVISLRQKWGSVGSIKLDIEAYMVEVLEDDGERAAGRRSA